jgi:hypothetical protein
MESETEFVFRIICFRGGLHYLADNWKWDKCEDVLRVVAGHQYCEKATALLIYWRSSPGYFVGMDVNDIPECNRELYELSSVSRASTQNQKLTAIHLRSSALADRS